MQTARILQAVVLMMIVALAASCAASKDYSSKLFSQKKESLKDSRAITLRFLELDKLETGNEEWVTTDLIMGRDTLSKPLALDKLSKIFPATHAVNDTATAGNEKKTIPIVAETKPEPVVYHPIAKNNNSGAVRNKRMRE